MEGSQKSYDIMRKKVKDICDELILANEIIAHRILTSNGELGMYYYSTKEVDSLDDVSEDTSDLVIYKRPPDYIRDLNGNYIGLYKQCLDYVITNGKSTAAEILYGAFDNKIRNVKSPHDSVKAISNRLTEYGLFIRERQSGNAFTYRINELEIDKLNLQVQTRRYIDNVSDTEINNVIYDLIQQQGQTTIIDILDELNVYREVYGKSHHEKGYQRVYNIISVKITHGILEPIKQEIGRLVAYKFS